MLRRSVRRSTAKSKTALSKAAKGAPAKLAKKGKRPVTRQVGSGGLSPAADALRAAALESGVRGTFVRRSMAALSRIAVLTDDRRLERALEAPTDIGMLARALSDTEVVGEGVEDIDPLASVIAKGVEHKQVLIAKAGGLLPVSAAAKHLQISPQAINKRRLKRQLLAIPAGSEFRFPAVQFSDDGVVKGLPDVLKALALGPWGSLNFLLAPDEQLGGLSPIAALKERPELSGLVMRLARSQGVHGP
jgi:hypothetical protein